MDNVGSDLFLTDGHDITYNGSGFYTANRVEFVEDINSFFKSGELSSVNVVNLLELGWFSLKDSDQFLIGFKNKGETESHHRIRMGIYGLKSQTVNDFGKSTKEYTYTLIEEPLYKKFYVNNIYRSWRNKKASEIIIDILTNDVGIQVVDKTYGDDPVLKSFIAPYWTINKTLRYLMNYIKGGPGKFFSVVDGTSTTYYLYPLQRLMDEGVKKPALDMSPSLQKSGTIDYKIFWDYQIHGGDYKLDGYMQGETTNIFNYFSGSKDDLDQMTSVPDFADNDKSKYKFENGLDMFTDIKKPSYRSVLSGRYEHGMKKELSKSLGDYSVYYEKGLSGQTSNMSIDIEPKDIVEVKMLNRFYNDFHKSLVMDCFVVPSKSILPGRKVNVTLPGKKVGLGIVTEFDESLTGEWLIEKIHHIIQVIDTTRVEYKMKCTLIKTGYSNNPADNDKLS